MGEASDIEWLSDHLDRLFGNHPFSPPGVKAQWSRWLAENNAACVGWGLQPTGKERWLPSGQRKAEELRLTLFGMAMVGTAVELLAWAEWLAEQHKDTPDEERAAGLHEDCSRLFAQSTKLELDAAKAVGKGKALDIEILRQRDSARKELGAARQEIAQLRALIEQRNQTVLKLEADLRRRFEHEFSVSQRLRRHGKGPEYTNADAVFEEGYLRALSDLRAMPVDTWRAAHVDMVAFIDNASAIARRRFENERQQLKRERELEVAAAQAVDRLPAFDPKALGESVLKGFDAVKADELAAVNAQLHLAQDLLSEIYDEGIALRHDEDCPQDDTCECKVIARLNEALKGMKP